jgi:hypothetical protein
LSSWTLFLHQRQEDPEPAPYSISGEAGPPPLQGVTADDGDDPPGGQGGDDCQLTGRILAAQQRSTLSPKRATMSSISAGQ